jgi:hypothetical protein
MRASVFIYGFSIGRLVLGDNGRFFILLSEVILKASHPFSVIFSYAQIESKDEVQNTEGAHSLGTFLAHLFFFSAVEMSLLRTLCTYV